MLKTEHHKGKWLLKGGRLYNPEDQSLEQMDIVIADGVLEGMDTAIEASTDMQVIDCSGLIISPGFTDAHVHFREPGQEHKESLQTGSEAAIAGGFTTVCCMPNTEPPIDNQESVRFIRQKQQELMVDIYPVAAATKGRKGAELTEYGEIAAAGAVGFTDDGAPIAKAGVMRRALEYVKITGKPIIQHAEDLDLKGHGLMHESSVSTGLGLPGVPGISEVSMVYRDIIIAEYVGSRLHFQHISMKESAELIAEAKSRGVNVTAEVTPHHLLLTDEAVRTFNTSTKVNPPLRSRADVDAMRQAVADGVIDIIATDHAPHSQEEKEQPFNLAPPGMIGLESALGIVIKALVSSKVTTLENVLYRLTAAPRKIFQLPPQHLEKGAQADLAVFDPTTEWVFKKEHVKSRSENSPFYGTQLIGCVKCVFNRHQVADFGLINQS